MIFPSETHGARKSDPWTSKYADHSVRDSAVTQREILLRVFNQHESGLTDEEAAAIAGVGGCWWKRCSELRSLGLIVNSGQVRKGTAGRPRIVCVPATAVTLFPMGNKAEDGK